MSVYAPGGVDNKLGQSTLGLASRKALGLSEGQVSRTIVTGYLLSIQTGYNIQRATTIPEKIIALEPLPRF